MAQNRHGGSGRTDAHLLAYLAAARAERRRKRVAFAASLLVLGIGLSRVSLACTISAT